MVFHISPGYQSYCTRGAAIVVTFLEVIQSNGQAQYMHGQFFDSREEAEEDYERRLERL